MQQPAVAIRRRKQQPDVVIEKQKATIRCGNQEEESNNQVWRSRRRKQQPEVAIEKKKATTRCEQGHQIDRKKIQSLPMLLILIKKKKI